MHHQHLDRAPIPLPPEEEARDEAGPLARPKPTEPALGPRSPDTEGLGFGAILEGLEEQSEKEKCESLSISSQVR